MAQNFKRRITLIPDSFSKFQNSLNKTKELDLTEKADIDTFNKAIIYKNTPKKDKKVKQSLLDTPSIEKKKFRKISIYSPISFGDISTPLSKKTISDFNSQLFSEEETDNITNINNISNKSFFPCGKFKKLSQGNKSKNIFKKSITLNNGNNKKYSFSFYYDFDIYGHNDIIKKNNISINNNINSSGENSDNEEIQKKHNLCVNELDKAINYINNNRNYFSDIVKNRKKCF